MAAKASEVLKAFATTSLGLGEEGVAPLFEGDDLTDGALEILNGKLAEKVATFRTSEETLKSDLAKLKDDLRSQKMRDKKEAFTEVEDQMRKEYGYDDLTKRGKELFDAIIAKERKAASSLDESKVKEHPLYREREQEIAKIPELLTAREQEVVARFQGEKDQQDVRGYARTIFKAWQPVLPEDAVKADTLESDFLDLLRNVPTKVTRDANGTVTDILPLKADKSGRLEDKLGNAIAMKDLVESLAAQRFDKRAAADRSGAPDPNKVGGGSGGGSVKYPATMTKAEYFAAQDAATSLPTREERRAATEALAKVQVTG